MHGCIHTHPPRWRGALRVQRRACIVAWVHTYAPAQVARRAASAEEDRVEAEAKLREEEVRRELQKGRRDEAEVSKQVSKQVSK